MSDLPDEQLLGRIDRLPTTRFTGSTYRHTTAKRDPLSGAGARLSGGRWNPRGLFPTIYLATPLQCCLAELDRIGQSQAVPVVDLLRVPRRLHEIGLYDVDLLDLRSDDQLEAAALEPGDIEGADWTPCQQIGHAAWFLGRDGIIVRSATTEGHVVALFEQRIAPGQVAVVKSEDLGIETYRRHRRARAEPLDVSPTIEERRHGSDSE